MERTAGRSLRRTSLDPNPIIDEEPSLDAKIISVDSSGKGLYHLVSLIACYNSFDLEKKARNGPCSGENGR